MAQSLAGAVHRGAVETILVVEGQRSWFWRKPPLPYLVWYTYRMQSKKGSRERQKILVGVDEVGRGAWAGPLVAAALFIVDDDLFPFDRVLDSKLLSNESRRTILPRLQASCRIAYGMVSHKLLDRIGLQAANVLAIDHALRSLNFAGNVEIHADHVGGFKNYTIHSVPISFHVRGESVFPEIAAASIAAKVFRDDLMMQMHYEYPSFGMERHKGYGTRSHREAIKKYGLSAVHRKSFDLTSR